MAEETQKKTPRDLLRAVFRHRTLFLASAALFAFATLVGACWWPLKYTATARFERRSDPASEDLVRGKSESFDALKMTLEHELVGTNAVDAAADELEKKTLLPALPRGQDGKLTAEGRMLRQGLVRNLMDALKVVFVVRSQEVDLVSVSFTDADPRLAQQLPNTLITNYITRIGEQIVINLTASRDFLQVKVDEANTRFVELTRKRIDFETKYAGLQPSSPDALAQELQKISSDMDTVRRQHTAAQQKVERIKALMDAAKQPLTAAEKPKETPAETQADGKTPEAKAEEKPASPADPSPELALRAAYTELLRRQEQLLQYKSTLEEAKTLGHMTDKHPRVIALRKQIADTENQVTDARNRVVELEARVRELADRARELAGRAVTPLTPSLDTSGRDAIIEGVRQRDNELRGTLLTMDLAAAQSEVDSTTNELARLQQRKDDVEKLLNQFGPIRQEYLGIVKDMTDQQAEVDRWQKRCTEVQMALAAEAAKRRTHLTQVELAQEQFKPSSPKLLYVLALALVGGLAFGGGLVFLTNTVDRSITTTEEAADHFGLPVLGTIGEIMTAPRRARRRMIRWGLGPVAAVGVALAIGAAALNITLWLNSREQYSQWRADPVQFVVSRIGDSLAGKI
ncbi:MAG: hypothetical protein IMZ44_05340 [Planctomycetes bacterium]|nr:hypothetical protein [Planctomycetota bacterium]